MIHNNFEVYQLGNITEKNLAKAVFYCLTLEASICINTNLYIIKVILRCLPI